MVNLPCALVLLGIVGVTPCFFGVHEKCIWIKRACDGEIDAHISSFVPVEEDNVSGAVTDKDSDLLCVMDV